MCGTSTAVSFFFCRGSGGYLRFRVLRGGFDCFAGVFGVGALTSASCLGGYWVVGVDWFPFPLGFILGGAVGFSGGGGWGWFGLVVGLLVALFVALLVFRGVGGFWDGAGSSWWVRGYVYVICVGGLGISCVWCSVFLSWVY